jgi:hypothetical protein
MLRRRRRNSFTAAGRTGICPLLLVIPASLFPVTVANISELQRRRSDDLYRSDNQPGDDSLAIVHRIACRALSDEERVGRRIQRDPRGEINGLLVQMMTIERMARAGLPKEGRELI